MDRVKIVLPNGGHRVAVDGLNRVAIKAGTVFELEGAGLEVELCTGNFKHTAPSPELIPFDLEAAKAGAPLVTRDGRKVDELHHFTTEGTANPVCAVVEGQATWFNVGGKSWDGSSEEDLFMAPKPKRTVWVNLYKDHSSCYHESPEEAKALALDFAIARAVPIEIDA